MRRFRGEGGGGKRRIRTAVENHLGDAGGGKEVVERGDVGIEALSGEVDGSMDGPALYIYVYVSTPSLNIRTF